MNNQLSYFMGKSAYLSHKLLVNVLQVPPGEYRLSAIAATPESAPELLFSPHHIDVVVNKPLLDINFYQV